MSLFRMSDVRWRNYLVFSDTFARISSSWLACSFFQRWLFCRFGTMRPSITVYLFYVICFLGFHGRKKCRQFLVNRAAAFAGAVLCLLPRIHCCWKLLVMDSLFLKVCTFSLVLDALTYYSGCHLCWVDSVAGFINDCALVLFSWILKLWII